MFETEPMKRRNATRISSNLIFAAGLWVNAMAKSDSNNKKTDNRGEGSENFATRRTHLLDFPLLH